MKQVVLRVDDAAFEKFVGMVSLINRLLERLHQADLKNFGSHLQIVCVASGGQHVETQINIGKAQPQPETLSDPPCVGREKGPSNLPEVLATDGAMALWKKAQDAGYVDEHYQPLLSRTQAAILADTMAERLGIKEKWKVFENLWNRRNMHKDIYEAYGQQQSLAFQEELKRIFG